MKKFIVKDYPMYRVTKCGKVFSHRKKSGKVVKKELKLNTDKYGYKITKLFNDNGGKYIKVHRLIAMQFIANPLNKPQVNHKNGIPSDNRLENLEWVTASENLTHAHRFLKITHNKPHKGKFGKDSWISKPVRQLTPDGQIIKTFDSMTIAARETGTSLSKISQVANGERTKANGCRWEKVNAGA